MPNVATTDHPLADAIAHRWSPRAFTDALVDKEKIITLLEAARWAASGGGQQPWSYIIATKDNEEEYGKLLSVLSPNNQGWAQRAPVLLLSLATTVTADGKPNQVALHDVGASSAQLSLQATALGLQAHQIGGFDHEKAIEEFQIPDGVVPVTAIAIGYVGDPDVLPERLKEREIAPRARKPLSEFVYSGKFGSVSPLVVSD
jgi:nitroreductase